MRGALTDWLAAQVKPSVSRDTVAENAQFMLGAALVFGVCLFHGVSERTNNRGDLLLVDGSAVFQPGHDGPQRELSGVIHSVSPFVGSIA